MKKHISISEIECVTESDRTIAVDMKSGKTHILSIEDGTPILNEYRTHQELLKKAIQNQSSSPVDFLNAFSGNNPEPASDEEPAFNPSPEQLNEILRGRGEAVIDPAIIEKAHQELQKMLTEQQQQGVSDIDPAMVTNAHYQQLLKLDAEAQQDVSDIETKPAVEIVENTEKVGNEIKKTTKKRK